MFDFITRAVTHPFDYLGTLSLHKLSLVRTEHIEGTVYSFVFKSNKPLSWKAGQHGVFWFFGKKMEEGIWRAFSIASSMHEYEIRIATHVGDDPSDFKARLLGMLPGDTIHMQGPFGEFHAEDKDQLVGIAGGVGITPFRAILHDIANDFVKNTNITLIYSAAPGEHVFKEELDMWAENTNRINIIYTETPEEVNEALTEKIDIFGDDAYYCISGSPGMVHALKNTCLGKGLTKIINDPFKGY